MLRISEIELKSSTVVLRVEGTIRDAWLTELARVLSMHLSAGRSVQLDLSSVRSIDSDAAEFLMGAAGIDFTIIRASKILTELIEQQGARNGQA